MRQANVLHAILPGSDDRYLAVLVHLEGALGLAPNWINRLAILGGEDAESRFRLSKVDARMLRATTDAAYAGPSLAEVAYREGRIIAEGTLLLRSALAESEPDTSMLETILTASQAICPVAAKDLMPQLQGAALGARLKELEQRWIASGFALSKHDLLGAA